jgi:hypothetical protein
VFGPNRQQTKGLKYMYGRAQKRAGSLKSLKGKSGFSIKRLDRKEMTTRCAEKTA